MKSKTLAGAIAGVVVLAAAPAALAAPVTVDLRVEGPTRTLVEQKVTVDVRPFKFSDDAQTYACDGTGATGTTTVPSPTRNGALAEAAERTPFELTGTFTAFGPTFDRIAGEALPPYSLESKFLVEYKNGAASNFGGCADTIAQGDDILFAYGDGSESPLRLTGPTTVKPGATATLTATTQPDGAPAADATVAGRSTGADGRVTTAALTQRGPQTFKAAKTGAIRSNAVTVCVTDGADGFCGTSGPGGVPGAPGGPGASGGPGAPGAADTTAAFAKIASITEGRRFAKGRGPRTLRGVVDAEPAGIADVRLRLSRTSGSRCSFYDGARERFVTARRCGIANARTFSVGAGAAFSYLLPAKLPAGRYVLDVVVLDRARNQTTTYQRGRNRVVFHVA